MNKKLETWMQALCASLTARLGAIRSMNTFWNTPLVMSVVQLHAYLETLLQGKEDILLGNEYQTLGDDPMAITRTNIGAGGLSSMYMQTCSDGVFLRMKIRKKLACLYIPKRRNMKIRMYCEGLLFDEHMQHTTFMELTEEEFMGEFWMDAVPDKYKQLSNTIEKKAVEELKPAAPINT